MRFTHFPPIFIFVLAAMLVAGGYGWGRLTVQDNVREVKVIKTPSSSAQPKELNFDLFWEAWQAVHRNYVAAPDDSKLIEGAIEGMVQALDDPYTTYLDPESAKELGEGLQGVFSGIGAEIAVKDRTLVVVSPLPESPAAKAGLKAQDEIQMIDDTSVSELRFADAIRLIRGPEGSTVKLLVMREGFAEPQIFSVTRGQIIVKSVTYEIVDKTVGYLKISAFHEDTTKLTQEALDHFIDKQVTSMVLDMRGNPGGLLNEGINIASLFLPSGVVVKQKGRDGAEKTYSTSLAAKMPATPIVVLVDEGSASAAEIVAGALQDYGRATVVGKKTFGKGSVQELQDLSNDGELKITVAHWFTPNDRTIDGTGIAPDIEIEITDADIEAKRDPQLDRAIDELTKED